MRELRAVETWADSISDPRASWIPVFTDAALSELARDDEPPTAGEAELAGPWRIEPMDDGDFGVFRTGDREAGEEPLVRIVGRQTALLAAACLPGLGRPACYRLDEVAEDGRFAISREGFDTGSCAVYLAELAHALDGLEAIVRSPDALALLLEAAGATALEQAGRRLGLRLATESATDRPEGGRTG